MTDIEQKALALVNEIERERGEDELTPRIMRDLIIDEALCRAIEQHEATKQKAADTEQQLIDAMQSGIARAEAQHEAFRQEVSDAVVEYFGPKHLDVILAGHLLSRFIIPATKPDPLVAAVHEVDTGPAWDSPEDYCNKIRAALEARGLEIRSKSDEG